MREYPLKHWGSWAAVLACSRLFPARGTAKGRHELEGFDTGLLEEKPEKAGEPTYNEGVPERHGTSITCIGKRRSRKQSRSRNGLLRQERIDCGPAVFEVVVGSRSDKVRVWMSRVSVLITFGLLLVVSLVMPASAQYRAGLRLAGAQTVAFASDGSRYAVWQESGRAAVTVVIDGKTWRQRQVAVPLGCRLALDESEFSEEAVARAHSGRFLLSCSSGQAVLNAGNGALQSLPALPGSYRWEEAGSRYAAGPTRDCAYKQCISVVELATGRVSVRHESAIPDLDRPGAPGARVCPALRRRVARALVSSNPLPYAYAEGFYAHAANRTGYIEIDRCKLRPILIPGRGEPRDFDLRDGLLTWDTGYRPSVEPNEESAHASVLGAYQLATATRRTWRLPRLSVAEEQPGLRTMGYSEHAGRTVFWIATRRVNLGKAGNAPVSSAVYSARF
jgi:hypothetical protein